MIKKFIFLSFIIFPFLFGEPVFAQVHPAANHVWERAAYGNIPGITQLFLNGNNGGITTTFEPLWPESAAYTPLAAAMSTPYCASSSASDGPASTGCLTMSVSGVDTSYAPFTETVTLNGQTSVNLTTTNVLFINSMVCLTTGSGFTNAGTIRCGTGSNTSGVPAVVHSHMAIGFSRSQSAMYFVPAGFSLICRNWSLSSYGVTAAQTDQFVVDTYTDPVAAKVLSRSFIGVISQPGGMVFPSMKKFAAKTLVIVQALSAASTGPVFAQAECLLIKDSWAGTAQTVF